MLEEFLPHRRGPHQREAQETRGDRVVGALAGNALSFLAMRATIDGNLTATAFAEIIEMATRYTVDVDQILVDVDRSSSTTQLSARAENLETAGGLFDVVE
ncbi:MAG TPA: hypothetical protein VNF05_03295 [Acidimicrobiales bacterium]|nr:hypothetical protein [Acidimicrobiales bacterium]